MIKGKPMSNAYHRVMNNMISTIHYNIRVSMFSIQNTYSAFRFLLIILLTVSIASCRTHKETAKNPNKEKSAPSAKIKTKYAQLLNVEEDKIENLKLYDFINDWYGVPYKYGGKSKEGIDCSAFTAALFATVYNKTLEGSAASIFYQCKSVSKVKLTEGDLVFFKIENDNITHVGVYLQNNKFVHASTKKGVMIDDLDEPYYKKYFFKGGKFVN